METEPAPHPLSVRAKQFRGALPDGREGHRGQGAPLEQRKKDVRMHTRKWSTTIVAAVALAFALAMCVRPVFAVDEAEFFCNGASGATCDLFQLDGADTATPNANTCVGTENGCPSDES